MYYVVVRDIEGGSRRDEKVFRDLTAAKDYYESVRRVCDNDPDEFGEHDTAIVSQCWLYAVDVDDALTAREMARNGQGELVLSYSEADLRDAEIL